MAMVRLFYWLVALVIANAVGLLLAVALLPGFRIDAMSFVIVALVFSGVQVLADPLLTKISIKSVPALRGSVALVTAFVGLFVTDFFIDGMSVGGISNWLAATLLVWLGSLIAGLLLPIYVLKRLREAKS